MAHRKNCLPPALQCCCCMTLQSGAFSIALVHVVYGFFAILAAFGVNTATVDNDEKAIAIINIILSIFIGLMALVFGIAGARRMDVRKLNFYLMALAFEYVVDHIVLRLVSIGLACKTVDAHPDRFDNATCGQYIIQLIIAMAIYLAIEGYFIYIIWSLRNRIKTGDSDIARMGAQAIRLRNNNETPAIVVLSDRHIHRYQPQNIAMGQRMQGGMYTGSVTQGVPVASNSNCAPPPSFVLPSSHLAAVYYPQQHLSQQQQQPPYQINQHASPYPYQTNQPPVRIPHRLSNNMSSRSIASTASTSSSSQPPQQQPPGYDSQSVSPVVSPSHQTQPAAVSAASSPVNAVSNGTVVGTPTVVPSVSPSAQHSNMSFIPVGGSRSRGNIFPQGSAPAEVYQVPSNPAPSDATQSP
eukprot:GILJ01001948.1.p1 GENE.GILJ01001948.1~~GILJ01001948.1.p1  ORF type:complete len:411 (+),score=69.47 GILJ01001948.1:57-1289(+)